ncbi:MAG: RDD family protein [Acidiferrobacterales bacterium]|nr:RDD family protein [Acidiferrobacterales bacterium]
MDFKPNFASYTYEELLDVKDNIDRAQYPDRYQEIVDLLASPERKLEKTDKVEGKREIDKYDTFWPRFWAMLIDGVLFAAILFVECLLFGLEYSTEDRFLQALNGIQLSMYLIIMHGVYGQSLGKMVAGVRVLNHKTETKIGVLQALRRESVNLALNVVWAMMILAVAISVELTGTITTGFAYMIIGFGFLTLAWSLSELVTMLFNEKRRALHDFIGKTVVVRA